MYRVDTGERHEVVSGLLLEGFAWLPDGSGIVYSFVTRQHAPLPPVFNLRAIQLDGSGDRQLTFGDQSYVEPDIHTSGKVVAGRITSRSDIWKIPVGGTPAENTASRGSGDATDRTGAGAVGESRQSRGRLRVGHRWAHESLDRTNRWLRHTPNHV